MTMGWMRGVSTAALIGVAAALSACSHGGGHGGTFVSQEPGGGMSAFHRGRAQGGPGGAANIGVNGYLWRATLDTLSFMPLASADPYGGTVITDWYSNPERPNERFKVTVYILDTRLRADGLKVTVFKQAKDPSGAWADATSADQTETDMENAILTRARQLRLSNVRGRG